MFIFDAGQILREIKGMRLIRCRVCKKETPHDLVEIGQFLTALDTPLLPYKKRFLVTCQKCNHAVEVSKKAFQEMMNPDNPTPQIFTEMPTAFRNKAAAKKKNKKHRFCRGCGAKLRPGAKFCNECGLKTGRAPK